MSKLFMLASAAFALCAFAGSANAEKATMIGAGNMQCGWVTDAYSAHGAELVANVFPWVEGFMTGLNVGAELTYRSATPTLPRDLAPAADDNATAMARLLQYCAAHPSASFWEAANALYKSMQPASLSE
jgi:hypothetical protein